LNPGKQQLSRRLFSSGTAFFCGPLPRKFDPPTENNNNLLWCGRAESFISKGLNQRILYEISSKGFIPRAETKRHADFGFISILDARTMQQMDWRQTLMK
jgi:hypothetical protein